MTRYFKLIKKYPTSEPVGTIFSKEYYSQLVNRVDTYLISIKKEEVINNTEYFEEIFDYNEKIKTSQK